MAAGNNKYERPLEKEPIVVFLNNKQIHLYKDRCKSPQAEASNDNGQDGKQTEDSGKLLLRKVLGASVNSIMSLLSMQFFKLFLIASVIAIPLTRYGIDSWLGNFAFRIGLQWDLFVVPAVVLMMLALVR